MLKEKKVRQDYIEQICHQKGAAKTLKQVAAINLLKKTFFTILNSNMFGDHEMYFTMEDS